MISTTGRRTERLARRAYSPREMIVGPVAHFGGLQVFDGHGGDVGVAGKEGTDQFAHLGIGDQHSDFCHRKDLQTEKYRSWTYYHEMRASVNHIDRNSGNPGKAGRMDPGSGGGKAGGSDRETRTGPETGAGRPHSGVFQKRVHSKQERLCLAVRCTGGHRRGRRFPGRNAWTARRVRFIRLKEGQPRGEMLTGRRPYAAVAVCRAGACPCSISKRPRRPAQRRCGPGDAQGTMRSPGERAQAVGKVGQVPAEEIPLPAGVPVYLREYLPILPIY